MKHELPSRQRRGWGRGEDWPRLRKRRTRAADLSRRANSEVSILSTASARGFSTAGICAAMLAAPTEQTEGLGATADGQGWASARESSVCARP